MWLTEETKLRPHWTMIASSYLGPFLFWMGLLGYNTLRIAAAVVCVFGVIDTIQHRTRRNITSFPAVMSIVGHIVVWCPYIGKHGELAHTLTDSLGLLFVVFIVYAVCNKWPYTLSPIAGIGIAMATGMIAMT